MKENELRKGAVLVIEDNPLIRKQLLVMLSGEYDVQAVASGPEALEAIQLGAMPEIILLDVVMPGMNGYQVCCQLKSNRDTLDIPVIFITGRNETEDIIKGFECGAVDYVVKPFRKAEMLARVRNHLELKRSKDVQSQLIASQAKLIDELETALTEIKTLRGLIPICLHCKRIRDDDQGYWAKLENYLGKHSEGKLSHCICPECMEKHYPQIKHPNCWEYKNCGREKTKDCPAVTQNKGQECWMVAGTMCGGKIQGSFASKIVSCIECDYYKFNTFKVAE